MTPRYLFLCGVGRSGTTVLRTSLGLHPEIYYNDRENNIVQDLVAVAQANCTSDSRRYAMVVEQVEYDRIFREAISQLLWPDQQLRSRPIRMAAINPSGDQLDYLCQMFPDAKIIGLVRNGIEVISSRIRYNSFADHEFQSHCDVWNRCLGVSQWGQENPRHFRQIRQEWFYDSTQLNKRLSDVFDWLGVSRSPLPASNILERLHHPTDSMAENLDDFAKMSEHEKKAYFQSRSNRWSEWTESQRSLFTSSCSELMDLLGYDLPWRD